MMIRCSRPALVLVLSLAVPACAPAPGPGSTDGASREVVTLRFQDGFVEVHSGPDGIRYTALDRDGDLLETGLTANDLLARYPEHFRALEEGIAGSPDAPLDASVNVPERELLIGPSETR